MFYENNISLITPYVYECIDDYRKDGLQDDLIISAIKEAVSRNARNWKYIDEILKDCRNNNIFTAKQFEIKQKEFQENKRNNKSIKVQDKRNEVVYNTDFSEYDKYAKKGRSG